MSTHSEDWGKPRKTSIGTADVPAEVRTKHLPNTSQKRHHFSELVQWDLYLEAKNLPDKNRFFSISQHHQEYSYVYTDVHCN